MRKGMNSLALHVQGTLGRDPHAGDLFVFRGSRGDRLKIIWHDGLGMSLYVKRLEASATEDDLAAEKAAAGATTAVAAFVRKKPSRKPFPEHLPRERVVEPAPSCCACGRRGHCRQPRRPFGRGTVFLV